MMNAKVKVNVKVNVADLSPTSRHGVTRPRPRELTGRHSDLILLACASFYTRRRPLASAFRLSCLSDRSSNPLSTPLISSTVSTAYTQHIASHRIYIHIQPPFNTSTHTHTMAEFKRLREQAARVADHNASAVAAAAALVRQKEAKAKEDREKVLLPATLPGE